MVYQPSERSAIIFIMCCGFYSAVNCEKTISDEILDPNPSTPPGIHLESSSIHDDLPVLMYDHVLFRDSGIATLRLYITAAAVIAQHYGAVFVLPEIGHDNHLAAMPGHSGSTVQSETHPFDYYFDAAHFISSLHRHVGLTAVVNSSSAKSCQEKVSTWQDISLFQENILNRSYLSTSFPHHRCFRVLSFPSIGAYTTAELRHIREVVSDNLRPSLRLAPLVALAKRTIQLAGRAARGDSEHPQGPAPYREAEEYGRGYNAVYVRPDEDWLHMCELYYYENCHHPLDAYLHMSILNFSPDVPILVAGKSSRDDSVRKRFLTHFPDVLALSTIINTLAGCCRQGTFHALCGALRFATAADYCQLVSAVGEHDLAIVEHELCVGAIQFIGNILSSFTFNVRDSRARHCRHCLQARSVFFPPYSQPPYATLRSLTLPSACALCGGSYVVGAFPSTCSSSRFISLCQRDLDIYVSGCNNSHGMRFLSCWHRVLLGMTIQDVDRASSRRLEEKIMNGMMAASKQG